MNKQVLSKLYELFLSDKMATLEDAVASGISFRAAFNYMCGLVRLGVLQECERGVYVADSGKLDYFMHGYGVWAEDEAYFKLRNDARAMTVGQISALELSLETHGRIDSSILKAERSDIDVLAKKGYLKRVSPTKYRTIVDKFTVLKILELSKEKEKEFALYVIANIQTVLKFKLNASKCKEEFKQRCALYNVSFDVDIDPLNCRKEDIAHLNEAEKYVLENILYDMKSALLNSDSAYSTFDDMTLRYPDDETGTTVVTDSVLDWTVELMLKMIANIKNTPLD